jgi:hypothetical protein
VMATINGTLVGAYFMTENWNHGVTRWGWLCIAICEIKSGFWNVKCDDGISAGFAAFGLGARMAQDR